MVNPCPHCIAEAQRARAQLRVDMVRENVQAMADYLPLSPKERELALLVVEGHTYRTIAEKLSKTEASVKMHMKHIFDLTGYSDRSELQAGFTLGVVPVDRPFGRRTRHYSYSSRRK